MKYFLGSCFSHNKLGQGQIQKFDEFEKSENMFADAVSYEVKKRQQRLSQV